LKSSGADIKEQVALKRASCKIKLKRAVGTRKTKLLQMAYKQRWVNYFEVLDADHSGFIEPKDAALHGKEVAVRLGFAEGTPGYNHLIQSHEKYVEGLIASFDANKDNKVSRTELIEAVEKLFVGKSVDELPAFWTENISTSFKALDTNHNGELSKEEVTHFVKKLTPHVSDAEIAQAYQWAKEHSLSKGKFDAHTLLIISYIWATSPELTLEAEILFPVFRKQ